METMSLKAITGLSTRYDDYTITPNFVWDALLAELTARREADAKQEKADLTEHP